MSKVLFITGASSGIGQATAHAAVQAGWRVGLIGAWGVHHAHELTAESLYVDDDVFGLPVSVGVRRHDRRGSLGRLGHLDESCE